MVVLGASNDRIDFVAGLVSLNVAEKAKRLCARVMPGAGPRWPGGSQGVGHEVERQDLIQRPKAIIIVAKDWIPKAVPLAGGAGGQRPPGEVL